MNGFAGLLQLLNQRPEAIESNVHAKVLQKESVVHAVGRGVLIDNMKYFIGHLLEGEAAVWHNTLAQDISKKFNIWKIWEKGPSHVTIFYPFETENIESVTRVLEDWMTTVGTFPKFLISGFGFFQDKAVFVKTEFVPEFVAMIEKLRSHLWKMPGMPQDDFFVWRPHATLAYKISPEELGRVWEYVQTLPKPHFIIPFSNITIFKFEDQKRWVPEKIFKIN